jgi:hypothetical protein
MEARAIISMASRFMGDEGGSAWNEQDMLTSLKSAMHDLFDRRPDLLLAADGLIDRDTFVEGIDADTELPAAVGRHYSAAMAHKICHFCYLEDADSTINERLAAGHLALYEKAIM